MGRLLLCLVVFLTLSTRCACRAEPVFFVRKTFEFFALQLLAVTANLSMLPSSAQANVRFVPIADISQRRHNPKGILL